MVECHTSYLFLFFLKCPGPPLDLHSFPTRRSSDLGTGTGRALCPGGGPQGRSHPGDFRRRGDAQSADAGDDDACRGGADRSEEHTSELQSRPHLVCRLLLEKKKKKNQQKSSKP